MRAVCSRWRSPFPVPAARHEEPAVVTLAIILAITFGQMVGFGVGASWYSELFAARLRYSGASLGFQIGAAVSGGITPFAAATFMAWTG